MNYEIYTRTAARLGRVGIKDPTAQIIYLAEEIDRYRDTIHNLKELLYGMSNNPNEPIVRGPFETEDEFILRLNKRTLEGKLTLNAARKSLGLPPIKLD